MKFNVCPSMIQQKYTPFEYMNSVINTFSKAEYLPQLNQVLLRQIDAYNIEFSNLLYVFDMLQPKYVNNEIRRYKVKLFQVNIENRSLVVNYDIFLTNNKLNYRIIDKFIDKKDLI